MEFKGLTHPNYGEMGTSVIPQGNGAAQPYGQSPATSTAPTDSTFTMGGTDSARSSIGYRPESGVQRYRPEAGRGDRLAANIVGGSTFGDSASGGYSGVYRGAGLTTNQ